MKAKNIPIFILKLPPNILVSHAILRVFCICEIGIEANPT
jgi:hypothetical protein